MGEPRAGGLGGGGGGCKTSFLGRWLGKAGIAVGAVEVTIESGEGEFVGADRTFHQLIRFELQIRGSPGGILEAWAWAWTGADRAWICIVLRMRVMYEILLLVVMDWKRVRVAKVWFDTLGSAWTGAAVVRRWRPLG